MRDGVSPIVPVLNSGVNVNGQNGGGIVIKQEPRYDQPPPPQASNHTSGGLDPQYARQRAAQLLQQQFGNQANNSIAAMQSNGLAMPGGQQQRPHGLQLPGQPQNGYQAQRPQQQQGQQSQQQQQQQPQFKQEPRDSMGLSQTDGTGEAAEEWDAIVLARNSRGDHEPMGRLYVDRIIRRQVEQAGQRLEAGGLMIPLDERKRTRRLNPSSNTVIPSMAVAVDMAASATTKEPQISHYDGAESDDGLDDVDDEDAINSDLDDSDDGGEAGIESTMEGDVILCLYDKVQRVKNKWKCTLKDGVVTVNGKE